MKRIRIFLLLCLLVWLPVSPVSGETKRQVNENDPQTLTNKTLTAPAVTNPTITGTIGGSPTITSPSITGTVGGSGTYTTPNLTGATLSATKTFDTNWESAEKYVDLQQAVTQLDTTVTTLVISQPKPITANITFPSTLSLQFISPGKLTCTTAGVTIQINGPIIAGTQQIFAMSGGCQPRLSPGSVMIPHWFGIDSTGGADVKPAFDLAFDVLKAAGGGVFVLPAGTYRYVSSTDATSTETFTREASNVSIIGAGPSSLINVEGFIGMRFGLPRSDINRYCTTPPATGCTPPAWGLPTYKQFNAAAFADKTVTMTVAADAALFAANNVVFLESGDAGPATGHPPFNFEYNEVVSADAGTGVVTLKYPLRNDYNSDDASYVPLIGVISAVPTNVTIRNVKVVYTGSLEGSGATVFQIEGMRDVLVDQCHFVGLTFAGYSQDIKIQRTIFEGNTATVGSFDWGDALRNLAFEDNTIRHQSQYGFKATGSIQHLALRRNLIHSFQRNATTGNGIAIAGHLASRPGRHILTDENTILAQGTGNGGCGVCVDLAQYVGVTRNTIELRAVGGDAGVGVNLSSDVHDLRVSDNTIRLKSNGTGIRLIAQTGTNSITRGVITENVIEGTGTGITLQTVAAGNAVSDIRLGFNQVSVTGTPFQTSGAGTFSGLRSTSNSFSNDRGSCTFAAATTCAVTFTYFEYIPNYRTVVTCDTNQPVWVTAKSGSGFTINTTPAWSATCEWINVP